jgi:hypothetical protein
MQDVALPFRHGETTSDLWSKQLPAVQPSLYHWVEVKYETVAVDELSTTNDQLVVQGDNVAAPDGPAE